MLLKMVVSTITLNSSNLENIYFYTTNYSMLIENIYNGAYFFFRMSTKRVNNTATARLKQDYMRIMRDPVPYVKAVPLPSNILEW